MAVFDGSCDGGGGYLRPDALDEADRHKGAYMVLEALRDVLTAR
jgi:hypothetical protein